MIPGSNLLNMALTAIAPAAVTYYQLTTQGSPNSVGLYVSAFAAGIAIRASVQAVDRSAYEAYGLDFERKYITVYMPVGAVDLARDYSGDQLTFAGNRYQLVGATDWYGMDGWVRVYAVLLVGGP